MRQQVTVFSLGFVCLLLVGNAEAALGAKAGVNFSQLWSTTDDSFRLGFNAGLFIQNDFQEYTGYQIELLYSRKGYAWGDDWVQLDYIEVPAYFRAFLTYKNFRPTFLAGIYAGFLTSAKESFLKVDLITNEERRMEYGVWDHYKFFNFGILCGVGFDIIFQSVILQFDTRWTMGVIPVINNDEIGAISVNFGIALP